MYAAYAHMCASGIAAVVAVCILVSFADSCLCARALGCGAGVVVYDGCSAYSSDSRASTDIGEDWCVETKDKLDEGSEANKRGHERARQENQR